MNEAANDDNTATANSVEDAFLDLLDQDIAAHPERLQPIATDLSVITRPRRENSPTLAIQAKKIPTDKSWDFSDWWAADTRTAACLLALTRCWQRDTHINTHTHPV